MKVRLGTKAPITTSVDCVLEGWPMEYGGRYLIRTHARTAFHIDCVDLESGRIITLHHDTQVAVVDAEVVICPDS